jgi:hypothetical protein
MEESVPTSRTLLFALGLAFAIPAAAYAYESVSAPSHHHHARLHHKKVAYRAWALGAASTSVPNVGFWLPSYTPSHEQYEIEGLTRSLDDCVRYGCIGNN